MFGIPNVPILPTLTCLIVAGFFGVLWFVSRPRTYWRSVPADQPKAEDEEAARDEMKKAKLEFMKRWIIVYLAFAAILYVGAFAFEPAKKVYAVFNASPTPTMTFTPRATATHTATPTPRFTSTSYLTSTPNATHTPPTTATAKIVYQPQYIDRKVIQTVIVTQRVVVNQTVIVYVYQTVIVTPTHTPVISPTPTLTETPTITPTLTETPTETSTP